MHQGVYLCLKNQCDSAWPAGLLGWLTYADMQLSCHIYHGTVCIVMHQRKPTYINKEQNGITNNGLYPCVFTWNSRLCIALFKNICVVLHLIICGIKPVVLSVVGIFIIAIEFVSTICEIALMCMPPNLANDKSTPVHAMSLCLEALTKSTSMTPCGITRPQ